MRSLQTFGLLLSIVGPATGQNLIALSANNHLIPIQVGSPLRVGPAVPLTGLQPGESMLGIDVRPATGQLYGLSDQGHLYTLDPATAVATQIGATSTVSLQGSQFGFDFNPTVDRIRITSDLRQNLRVHPTTGAVVAVDGMLAYAAGDPNAAMTPEVAASAYTNSFAGATSTTLFAIDSGLDALVSQVPPNSGTLNTIGSLGRDVTSVAGFDIAPDGIAFAALNSAPNGTNGTTQLAAIDLSTGSATVLGTIGNANPSARLRGLAVMPPAADTELVVLTSDGRLATCFAAAPWATQITGPIRGLQPGEALFGIDFRPSTGQLYGIGTHSRLYAIDPTTAVASQIGAPLNPLLLGREFGIDFNPTVDRLRITSDLDQNLRVHPDTGAVVATDGSLAYAAGDIHFGGDPGVTASAYTNNLPGATSTLLFGIDTERDVLVSQVPPNSGTLNTIGSLGRDVIGTAGFDIASNGEAYAALTDASGCHLHRVDLATGALTMVGDLGLAVGASVRGLAARSVGGLRLFGNATPGCLGPAWLGAAGTPSAGNREFEIVLHHAPATTLGFVALTQLARTVPVTFQGLEVWVNSPTLLALTVLQTDAQGSSRLPMPLGGAWFGLPLHYQWIGVDACGPMGLAASSALTVTVQ